MTKALSKTDAALFDSVASTSRWQPRLLAVARAIMVDGAPTNDAATEAGITPAHARDLVRRFAKKLAQRELDDRLEAFMAKESPQEDPPIADPAIVKQIRSLGAKGYSPKQASTFLKSIGIKLSTHQIKHLLGSPK